MGQLGFVLMGLLPWSAVIVAADSNPQPFVENLRRW